MTYRMPAALSLALFLTACTNVSPKPQVTTVKETKIVKVKRAVGNTPTVTPNKNTTIMPAKMPITSNNGDIQGNYILERGQISFGDIRKNISSSDLVIEKLNENDFGYYYTVQIEGHTIDKFFGIFNKKDGKFVQKIISDGGEVSYYDNIELIKEGERLKLTVKTNQGKRIIIWNKINDMTESIDLLNAKKSYTGVCKAKYNELILR